MRDLTPTGLQFPNLNEGHPELSQETLFCILPDYYRPVQMLSGHVGVDGNPKAPHLKKDDPIELGLRDATYCRRSLGKLIVGSTLDLSINTIIYRRILLWIAAPRLIACIDVPRTTKPYLTDKPPSFCADLPPLWFSRESCSWVSDIDCHELRSGCHRNFP